MSSHATSSLPPLGFETAHGHAWAHGDLAPRADARWAVTMLDFAGRSVHLYAGARGAVGAWYFGVKPRDDATVIALGRAAWCDGHPTEAAQAHAAALIARGISVLLVDVRRTERVWFAWLGCTRERVMRAAAEYLEDRGHDAMATNFLHVG
jgi:hypothetical protein